MVTAGPNYTHPIPLHFVHHRSPRQDAIPLLHIHDSLGSFIEVEGIIDSLTNPQDTTAPAFHVVAPDIPGFGFSPAPEFPGLGLREVGQGFNDLMSQLGYERYVIGGGDFGALTLRHMATDFPDSVASVCSYFYLVYPNSICEKGEAQYLPRKLGTHQSGSMTCRALPKLNYTLVPTSDRRCVHLSQLRNATARNPSLRERC